MHPSVHNSTISKCQDTEATQVPIKQMDKEEMVYIYSGI